MTGAGLEGGADGAGRPLALRREHLLYLWLSALYTTALIIANVTGVKLFRFELPPAAGFGIEHTAGMLAFPVTFLLTDLINEYYGKRATRLAAYIAFSMAAVAFIFVSIARALPIREGIPGTATHEAFETIFGGASLMYIASLAAFLVGALLDIALFGMFKRLTRGRWVWLRATGSTVISQLFDSFIVTFLFFQALQRLTGGDAPDLAFTVRTALTGYILKFVIAVLLTPVVYAGRWAVRRYVGLTPLPPEPASPGATRAKR